MGKGGRWKEPAAQSVAGLHSEDFGVGESGCIESREEAFLNAEDGGRGGECKISKEELRMPPSAGAKSCRKSATPSLK